MQDVDLDRNLEWGPTKIPNALLRLGVEDLSRIHQSLRHKFLGAEGQPGGVVVTGREPVAIIAGLFDRGRLVRRLAMTREGEVRPTPGQTTPSGVRHERYH
jgi:hypothetical protein